MKIIDTDIKIEYEIDLDENDLAHGISIEDILEELSVDTTGYKIEYRFSVYTVRNGAFIEDRIDIGSCCPLRVRITCTK